MYCNLNKAIPVIEEMISRPGGATIKEIKDILKIKTHQSDAADTPEPNGLGSACHV